MTNEPYELSRRKVLGSLGAIGAASAGAGLGTTAYFSDEESFEGNSLTAGELDLKLDWQEHYNGARIEAYPDHDDDGVQDAFASEPGGTTENGIGYVCEDGADTPADLDPTASLRSEIEGETYGSGPPLPLVHLDDVKPGDSGELTFSLHLCDNPGYVWMNGALTANRENGLTEPEGEVDATGGDPGEGNGELADAIETMVWYDSGTDGVWNPGDDEEEGDNVKQVDERLIAQGALADVLTLLSTGPGLPLDANLDGGENAGAPPQGPEITTSQTGNVVSGTAEASAKLNCTTVGGNPKCADLGLFNAKKLDIDANEADGDTELELGDYDTPAGTVTIEAFDEDDGTVTISTDFDVSAVITKGGPNARVCLADGDEDDDALEDGDAVELDGATFRTPINPNNDENYGLSHVQVCYAVADEEPPNGGNGQRECFENSTTYHVGFAWWLPADVGNEVQTDSVGVDLGFYTEQCRHNDGSGLASE